MANSNSYVDVTARTARNHWFLNHGFKISGDRPLNRLSKAAYFVWGLMLNAYDSLLPSITNSFQPADAMATVQNNDSVPFLRNISVSPAGFSFATSSRDSGAIRSVTNRVRDLIPKEKLREVVYVLAGKKPFFTREELVRHLEENQGRNYRAPLSKVGRLLDELVEAEEIKKTGQFYHVGPIDPPKMNSASEEVERFFRKFKDEIDSRIEQLEVCDNHESLWNIIHDDRANLGFRGVYLFQKVNGFKQVHYTSDREPLYKEEAKPEGVMKAVMESDRIVHRVEIGENMDSTLINFKAASLIEADPRWIEESLIRYGIGSIDLLKLTDGEGNPVGVLYLRDPVYFGEEQQIVVDNKLAKLALAIGRTITRLAEKSKPPSVQNSPEEKLKYFEPVREINQSTEKLLRMLEAREKEGVRVVRFDRKGRRFEDYTIDKPAQIVGQELPLLLRNLNSIWDGLSLDFLKKVVLRSTKINFKVEKTVGSKVPVGYSVVTRKEKGTYFEIMAAHEQAQKLQFSTRDTFAFVNEAFIEDASSAMIPKMKWFSRLRFQIKLWWAFQYARGRFPKLISRPPREFEDIRTRVAFLTDTDVGLSPFYPYIDRVFPNPDFIEGKSFEPSAEILKELLPEGYEPIKIMLEINGNQVPVYVVRSHEPRQKGEPPKYTKNLKAEKLVRDARSSKTNGLPEGDYDLLVCLEIDIHDFRRFFDLNKKGKDVNRTTQDTLAKAANVSSII